MSKLDAMHKEIETIFSMDVDHIHCDTLHFFIDEQENKLQQANKDKAELEDILDMAAEYLDEAGSYGHSGLIREAIAAKHKEE